MLEIDAPDLIASFGSTFTVTRRTAATFAAGIAVPGTATTFPVIAAFWPASGDELERLPELRYSSETRAGVCDTALLVGGHAAAYEADQVSIDGVAYEVKQSAPWPNVPSFYSVIIQKPDVP